MNDKASHEMEQQIDGLVIVDLQEPLLVEQTVKDNMQLKDDSSSCHRSNTQVLPLKVLSLVSGSFFALLSQIILWATFWDDSILHSTTVDLIGFSLGWSFWTCVILFTSMLALVQSFRKFYISGRTSKQGMIVCNNEDLHVEDLVFLMEAHFVVGALAAISIAWMVNNCFHSATGRSEDLLRMHPILTVTLATFAYCLFVRWIISKGDGVNHRIGQECAQISSSKYETLSSTFQMVAATLGIIVGVSSQFTLSILLWRDGMSRPLIQSPIIFCAVWSLVTVSLTHAGCLSLRFLVASSSLGDVQRTASERILNNRLLLRMEAAYVFFSLLGICSAWVGIDVLTGMTNQIVPSIFMLAAALLAFRAILYCFPEDNCIEAEDDEEARDMV